jgi:ABC-type Na+ efflux pump permease subunit
MDSTLGFLAILFLIGLAILWFLLPFAIFGTKDILSHILAEQKRTNELLKQLLERIPPNT